MGSSPKTWIAGAATTALLVWQAGQAVRRLGQEDERNRAFFATRDDGATEEERVAALLGPGRAAWRLLRDHTPEDAYVYVAAEPGGDALRFATAIRVLLYPRAVVQLLVEADPPWRPDPEAGGRPVFLFDLHSGLDVPWEELATPVAADGPDRLWRLKTES